MKIVAITLGGGPDEQPANEGWVIINYSDLVAGGKTGVGAPVARKPDGTMPSWADVAALLHMNMIGRSEWPDFIRGSQAENRIRLVCPDNMDTTSFSAQWNPQLDQQGAIVDGPAFVVVAEETV